VAEGRAIDHPELGDRERRRREREADVRVRELGAQPLAPGQGDVAVVERHRGQVVDGVPGRVLGDARVDVRRHEAEVRRGDEPLLRIAPGVAPRLELLQVGEVADVDLGREMAANRLL
jgi:hypothetical protein